MRDSDSCERIFLDERVRSRKHGFMNQDPIQRFKAAFHRSETLTQLNNAGVAPISRPALEAVEHWGRRLHQESIFAVTEGMQEVARTRQSLARLLGAHESEISFFSTTAAAISQVAFGLDFNPGDEILVWDQEYPSNIYPWRDAAARSGATLVMAPSGENLSTPLENLLSKVTSRTRVIAVSWVQYQTGAITDLRALAEFARPRGILTIVDGIQGVGLLPMNFHDLGIDAICGGSHKWLVSPLSVGYLCLREELYPTLKPLMVGAMTYGTPDDGINLEATPKPGGIGFEPGSRALLDLAAFGASLEFINGIGIERIAQETEWLARKLTHGLRERGYVIHSPHGPHHRGSIINFSPGPDAPIKTLETLGTALSQANISFGRRKPGLRLAPHAFNTGEDLDRVFRAVLK